MPPVTIHVANAKPTSGYVRWRRLALRASGPFFWILSVGPRLLQLLLFCPASQVSHRSVRLRLSTIRSYMALHWSMPRTFSLCAASLKAGDRE